MALRRQANMTQRLENEQYFVYLRWTMPSEWQSLQKRWSFQDTHLSPWILACFSLSLLPYTEVSKLDCVCANIRVRCLFSEIMGFYECCSVHAKADVTSKTSYTLVLELIFLALDLEILVLRDRLWLLSYCTGICSLSTAGAETTLFEVHGNSPTNF